MTESSDGPARRRLTRSSFDRVFTGVCGGLAEYLGIDPVIPRVVFGVGVFFAPWLLVGYGVLWLALPPDQPREREHERLGPWPWLALIPLALLLVPIAAGSGLLLGGPELLILVVLPVGILLVLRRRRVPYAAAAAAPPQAESTAPVAEPQVPAWWHAPPPTRPPRPKSPLARATVGAACVVAGTTLLARQPLRVACALALGTVGAGLVVGGFRGRGRPLIPLALLLVPVLAVTHLATLPEATPRRGTYLRPVRTELLPVHRQPTGSVTLDLREMTVDREGGSARIDVGVGRVVVILPPGIRTYVDVQVGMGLTAVVGDRSFGPGRGTSRTFNYETDRSNLNVYVRVGIGRVEVRRAG